MFPGRASSASVMATQTPVHRRDPERAWARIRGRSLRSLVDAGLFALALLLVGQTSSHAAEAPSPSSPVSFSKDLAPIFQQKCVTCHGPEKTKGGYQLHTFEGLMKGGESKEPVVTPGQPQRSKLFELLVAKDPDDRMPQKDD